MTPGEDRTNRDRTSKDLSISATINGRPVAREAVLKWEARRLAAAARKIGLSAPGGSLVTGRQAFCESKLALAPDEIRRRLRRDIGVAGTTARVTTKLSAGRRSTSTCDLDVTGGSAEAFVEWFSDVDREDYAWSMVAANPDHFLIDTAPDGRQEVIETTGGSPLATRFFVDYDDVSSLVTPADAGFELELAGVARDGGGDGVGPVIGGVRHQFRDTPDGFQARLCVEFPRVFAPWMITQHRWHLACEFSNWIEAAFAAR